MESSVSSGSSGIGFGGRKRRLSDVSSHGKSPVAKRSRPHNASKKSLQDDTKIIMEGVIDFLENPPDDLKELIQAKEKIEEIRKLLSQKEKDLDNINNIDNLFRKIKSILYYDSNIQKNKTDNNYIDYVVGKIDKIENEVIRGLEVDTLGSVEMEIESGVKYVQDVERLQKILTYIKSKKPNNADPNNAVPNYVEPNYVKTFEDSLKEKVELCESFKKLCANTKTFNDIYTRLKKELDSKETSLETDNDLDKKPTQGSELSDGKKEIIEQCKESARDILSLGDNNNPTTTSQSATSSEASGSTKK